MPRSPDLEKMDLTELKALAKDIDKAVKSKEREQFKKARAAAEDAAKKYGFSLDEITDNTSRAKKTAAAPKYRNPENSDQTWTGRGRQPDWYKAALAGGASPDELAA